MFSYHYSPVWLDYISFFFFFVIAAMTFPTEGHDTTYAFQLKEAVTMLRTKHADNYLVRTFLLLQISMSHFCLSICNFVSLEDSRGSYCKSFQYFRQKEPAH